MFLFSNLLVALAKILDLALTLYMWILIARAVVSWVNADPFHPAVRFLRSATEPVLAPIRARLPVVAGGIDFSPVLVILGIVFLKAFLVQSLVQIAMRLS